MRYVILYMFAQALSIGDFHWILRVFVEVQLHGIADCLLWHIMAVGNGTCSPFHPGRWTMSGRLFCSFSVVNHRVPWLKDPRIHMGWLIEKGSRK